MAPAAPLAGEDLVKSLSGRGSFSQKKELASASIREAWNVHADMFHRSQRQEDDGEELLWAALERLPTYDRVRKGVLKQVLDNGNVVHGDVDVTKLAMQDKKRLLESILKFVEEDNEQFLRRLRERIDRYNQNTGTYIHACIHIYNTKK